MGPEGSFWKRCSTCKKELPFVSTYWACNVSTCNRPRTALAFCSVACWDAHVPMLRHRDAWSAGSGLRRRDDARPAPVLAEPLVEHGAVAEREEREVPPHAHVRPRVHARTALTDEDVAGPHALAGEDLDPAPLPGAVAPVAGAALTLLVRHYAISVTRTVVIDCRWPRRRR